MAVPALAAGMLVTTWAWPPVDPVSMVPLAEMLTAVNAPILSAVPPGAVQFTLETFTLLVPAPQPTPTRDTTGWKTSWTAAVTGMLAMMFTAVRFVPKFVPALVAV